ncbi:hypothetical protein CV83906_2p059 (plasmid) [Escherichia coli]|nr:hypothetical protein CV83906_2p059 [Escherichia coli]
MHPISWLTEKALMFYIRDWPHKDAPNQNSWRIKSGLKTD